MPSSLSNTSIQMSCLGSGRDAVVHMVYRDNVERVEKHFHEFNELPPYRDPYNTECRAYKRLRGVSAVSGRVPSFHGKDDASRTIYLEYIRARPLSKAKEDMSSDLLRQCYEALSRTLMALHEAGISHGDIRDENILVRHSIGRANAVSIDEYLVFIDFGHAIIDGDPRWNSACRRDLGRLKWVCSEAIAKASVHISQEELARLVKGSWPDRALIDAVRTVGNPRPILILALARALYPYNDVDARKIIEEYQPPDRQTLLFDYRSSMMLKGDQVRWLPKDEAVMLLPRVIREASTALGPVDPYTLELRDLYGRCIGKRHHFEAREVFISMLDDLQQVEGNVVDEVPDHLFKEVLHPGWWIDRVKKRIMQLTTLGGALRTEPKTQEDIATVESKHEVKKKRHREVDSHEATTESVKLARTRDGNAVIIFNTG